MHIPKTNAQQDEVALQQKPLGTWSTVANGAIVVKHVPFLFKPEQGEQGVLVGHIAKANPVWKQLDSSVESVVAFHSEQAYVSPSWYPSKQAHGKAVPTWNYAVVHMHGTAKVIEDQQWLLAHVAEISAAHEQHFPEPWSVNDAPADFIENLSKAIVGIEIPITKIEGKWKLSQNRSVEDQQGVVNALAESSTIGYQAMAALMRDVLGLPA